MSSRSVPVGTGSMFLNDDDEDWLILAASRFFVITLKKKKIYPQQIYQRPNGIFMDMGLSARNFEF